MLYPDVEHKLIMCAATTFVPIDLRVETSELAEEATPMVAEAHRWSPNIFFLESTNTTTSTVEVGGYSKKGTCREMTGQSEELVRLAHLCVQVNSPRSV